MAQETFQEVYEWLNTFSRQDDIFSPTNAKYDFEIEKGVLAIRKTLQTPVMMALFCEKQASDVDVENPLYRRGHYTTMLRTDGHEVGSLLWNYTEKRTVNSDEVPNIQDDLMRATAFLVEQGQAKDVDIACGLSENRKLTIAVEVTPQGDIEPFSKNFLV